MSVVKEKCKQSQSVLQWAALGQRDGPDEAFEGRNGIVRNGLRTQRRLIFLLARLNGLLTGDDRLVLLLPVEETCLKVHDCPSMPRLVPVAVVLRRCSVVRQDGRDRFLLNAVLKKKLIFWCLIYVTSFVFYVTWELTSKIDWKNIPSL